MSFVIEQTLLTLEWGGEKTLETQQENFLKYLMHFNQVTKTNSKDSINSALNLPSVPLKL